MATLLLTGFEPFDGDAGNPSGDAVRRVAARWSGPERLVTEILPVTFDGAAERMRALIAAHSPTVVLAVGLAGGATTLRVERVALNLADARIPDNAGAQPLDEPSVPGAPAALFATLPVKAIARDLTLAGLPAEVSYSAGTFVCNHVFFVARQSVDAIPGARAGFLHVPWDRETRPGHGLPLSEIVRAVEIALRTSADRTADASVHAGTLS